MNIDEIRERLLKLSHTLIGDKVDTLKASFENFFKEINVYDYLVTDAEDISNGVMINSAIKITENDDFYYIPVKFLHN